MVEFKIGDRVKIRSGEPYMGAVGVIKEFSSIFGSEEVLVVFEENERIKSGWCLKEILEPAPYSVNIPKPTRRIIIEGDENTSRAKYIVGKQVIKEATAKRYHLDFPEPSVAARVLIDKMFPHTAEKAEPPKFFNGRIVCIEKQYQYAAVTVGKIYEVTNGQLVIDNGVKIPANPINSVNELNNRYGGGVKFIEIKEN